MAVVEERAGVLQGRPDDVRQARIARGSRGVSRLDQLPLGAELEDLARGRAGRVLDVGGEEVGNDVGALGACKRRAERPLVVEVSLDHLGARRAEPLGRFSAGLPGDCARDERVPGIGEDRAHQTPTLVAACANDGDDARAHHAARKRRECVSRSAARCARLAHGAEPASSHDAAPVDV
jgi:hypothetical protein